MLDGNIDAWEDYCKLRKEVKDLIRKKKIDIWNDVVEKVNTIMRDVGKNLGLLLVGKRVRRRQ